MAVKLFKNCLLAAFFLQLTCSHLYADGSKPKVAKGFVDRLIVKYGDQVFTQKEIESTFAIADALIENLSISNDAVGSKKPSTWKDKVTVHSYFLTSLGVAKASPSYRPNKKLVERLATKLQTKFPGYKPLKRIIRQWLWVQRMAEARQRQGQDHFHASRWFKRAHSKVRILYYSGAFKKKS